MSATVKIILHSKEYNDGTHAVMLQCKVVSPAGTVWKRRTLCKVKVSQFDKSACRVIKHPNMLVLNVRIADAFNLAEKKLHTAQLEGRKIDPDQIIAEEAVISNPSALLLASCKKYVERCMQKGQIHTSEKYSSHMHKLAEYLGNDRFGNQIDIHMDDINEDWVLAWAAWLRHNGSKSDNTLHRRMAFLNTLFIDARRRGFTKADPMAFVEFKEAKVRKPKLTEAQLKQLESVELTGRQADARNTFMLQYYAYGSRISDALTWKKDNIRKEGDTWYLHYISMKTGDLIDVRLSEKAKVMIAYYLETVSGKFLLPWLAKFEDIPGKSDIENKMRLIAQIESKTQMVNVLLKEVAEKAGIEVNLTTHIARHTFATLADRLISDKRKISAALGHSKFSTTEIYLAELRQSDVNDAMDQLWH
ncbi:tyrosine-type recombinase/integrase [Spirosoma oryzicola]|uniref:tyrosine-type recombinase/integrase n=1 Tax=Spirosoma oryzicola TaxID=2898794 RepID=UPI001E4B8CCF|nr:site-specific integrase [Spirosoma oryzicola]UHG93212.1 site-specific integrase [Spirosoma oryzicola]